MRLNSRHIASALALLPLMAGALGMGTLAASVSGFPDVPDTHIYADAIGFTKEKKMVQGYRDGTFRPDEAINRAEFAKFLTAFLFPQESIVACLRDPNLTSPFPDVPQMGAVWYGPSLCTAWKYGIIEGYPDKTFGADRLINAAEMAAMTARALGLQPASPVDPAMPWYWAHAVALHERGAIPPTALSADKLITRGEMAYVFQTLFSLSYLSAEPPQTETHEGPPPEAETETTQSGAPPEDELPPLEGIPPPDPNQPQHRYPTITGPGYSEDSSSSSQESTGE